MTDDPKDSKPDDATPATPPQAAADKPPAGPADAALKGEVSRTDSPGAGVSAAPKPAVPAEHKPAAAAPALPADPAPPADVPLPSFITALQSALPGAVEQVSYYVGDWTVIVPAGRLLEVARFLRDTPGIAFSACSDVTASDWPSRPQRFDVIYCLYSISNRVRVRIKVRAAELEPVPSVTGIWPGANWLEREVYDLFGVNFTGHPDRRRILMPEDWQGYPQRKDYPLEGPGELLMENPLDWLKLRQQREEAEIE